ncbi:MAG: hypothetical protein GEU90_04055 [Gemmatimonas sp.]|nr:hypothetical protein [Gemmatimonas sp.]
MRLSSIIATILATVAIAPSAFGQAESDFLDGVPTPTSYFGFKPGSDRELANWSELSAYYDLVAQTSPRVEADTLGLSTNGLPFVMLTITSQENHGRLSELKDIQLRLADPRSVSGPEEAEGLIEEGRTVVMITQNIHSTEVGAAQMAPNLLYRLAASNDEDVLDILDTVILLHIPSLNPDGTELVSNWYRKYVGTPFEAAGLVELYHPYVGHDNNRDWYTFTQKETQLTVAAQNDWHPQIVHDVHQMGGNGARIFTPPYTDPAEPNIDPLLIAGVNQLGMYMAAELISDGKKGVVSNAQYDMFTPARAYMHYHGGARILTETASARLATPDTVTPEDLAAGRGGRDYTQPTWNFSAPWEGGEWGLPQIVDYQETAAFALLKNAASNREYWLRNFYRVNQRAVDGWPSWPQAWVIPEGQDNADGVNAVLRILRTADVEVHRADAAFSAAGREFPAGSYVIPMQQPYASFAQAMLTVQDYPNLLQYPGGPPIRPYDVTAHTLPLLMNMEAVPVEEPIQAALSDPVPAPPIEYAAPDALTGGNAPRLATYKGWNESMPAGWTRWVLDQHGIAYDTLHNADIRAGDLHSRYDVILFQDQSARSIAEGFSSESMPEEYVGGLGPEGAEALREFVRSGGRVIAIESATDYIRDVFELDINDVTQGVPPQDFYIPGSILRLSLDPASAIAAGVGAETIAWYWGSSRAWEVSDPEIEVVAWYGEGAPRLSGWVLGSELIGGKPAILETQVGDGSIVLFGFQPNYRAQTIATWPLLFNAMVAE